MMTSISNAPRRAWQRRTLSHKRPAASQSVCGSEGQVAKRARAAPRRESRYGREEDDSDFSFVPGSDSDSDCSDANGGAWCPDLRRTPQAPRRETRLRPENSSYDDVDADIPCDSDADSGFDSGYHSLEDDSDDKADYYDELLEQFRAEGPTLANHGENTEKMEKEQEEKWDM